MKAYWITVVGNRYTYGGGALGNDPHCQHSEGHEQPRTVEGGRGSLGSGPVGERAPSDLGLRDLGMVGGEAAHPEGVLTRPQPERSTSMYALSLSPITTAVRCKRSGPVSLSSPFSVHAQRASLRGMKHTQRE